jgi:hypothetical protein
MDEIEAQDESPNREAVGKEIDLYSSSPLNRKSHSDLIDLRDPHQFIQFADSSQQKILQGEAVWDGINDGLILPNNSDLSRLSEA